MFYDFYFPSRLFMFNNLFFHVNGFNPTTINISSYECSNSFCHLTYIVQIKFGCKSEKYDRLEGLLFTIEDQEPTLEKENSKALQALSSEEHLSALVARLPRVDRLQHTSGI